MTQLLVSVRTAEEAQVALAAGADLIDVKDPAAGSLGAPESSIVEEVVATVAARAPVSVALGELRDWCQMDNMAIPRGVDYAKLGMAGSADWSDWPDRWAEAIRRFPLSVRPVAVIYADGEAVAAPEPDQVLAEAQRLGCAAVLVDTFDKSRGGLLDVWPSERIAWLVAAARSEGMLAVVGGSLTLETIARVASLGPDYIALRGAVCRGGRKGPLDADRVREAARCIAAANSAILSRIA
jgi:uncharacterized protein (UPF0264 family)